MDKLVENAPRIIEEAGKNPFALVALCILVIAVVAVLYFRDAREGTRIVMFVLLGFGVLMLVIVVVATSIPSSGPAPVAISPPEPSSAPAPQSKAAAPLASSKEFVKPPALPQNTCPPVAGMFWMTYPDTWYGPYNGYALAYSGLGGFHVMNPNFTPMHYPDPYRQVQRNTWLNLPNSPFNICVDGVAGNVFGQYGR